MIQILRKIYNEIITDYLYSLKPKHQYILQFKARICSNYGGYVLQTRPVSVLMNHMTMWPLDGSLGNLEISGSKKQKIEKFKYKPKSLYGLLKAQKSSLKFSDNILLKTLGILFIFYFYFYHLASTGNKLKESKIGSRGDNFYFLFFVFSPYMAGKKRSLKLDPKGRGHVDTTSPNQNLNSNSPR